MTQEEIQKTAHFVKSYHGDDTTGHDWWHVRRVWRNTIQIAGGEKADRTICELAALLHDLEDWKLGDGHEDLKRTKEWLCQIGLGLTKTEAVLEAIHTVSYRGAGVETKPSSIEGAVVQDADRLDAIGAIGVARAFAYGGGAGRKLHDPTVPPTIHGSFEEYKSGSSTTVNHFYEKLLLLRDRMNTRTGRDLAEERHRFVEAFLQRFLAEWDA